MIGLAVIACGLSLAGCSGVSLTQELPDSAEITATAPLPRTEPEAHTGVLYVRQKSGWHQLRINLEANGPREDSVRDSYSFHFKSSVSVWRFNGETGEYDILVASGTPGAHRGVSFGFHESRSGNVLILMPGNGGASGGSNGLADSGFTSVTMSLDPEPGASGVAIEDEMDVSVTTAMTVKPTDREREKGTGVRVARVTRTWKVKVMPGRRAEFSEILP